MNRSEKRRQNKIAQKGGRKANAGSPTHPQNNAVDQALSFAVQHHNAGRLSDAEKIYQQILQADAKQPDALHLLGMIALQTGKPDRAVILIGKALSANPRFGEAHYSLGLALMELGKLDEAVASYRKALEFTPNAAKVYYSLGNTLRTQRNIDEAIACYLKAVQIDPSFAVAHNNLGALYLELQQLDKAIASFQSALGVKPDYVLAHYNLGDAHREAGELDKAISSYRQTLVGMPTYVDAHFKLIEALDKANRTDDMQAAVDDASKQCPADPRIAYGEALLLKRKGDFVAARAIFDGVGEPQGEVKFLAARAQLLGDLCDRIGDIDAAFASFEESNQCSREKPEARHIDGPKYVTRIEALSQRFTADWVSSWNNVDVDDTRRDPVFLVGFPRSGTTLLDTILRSHPAIAVVEEQSALENIRQTLEDMPGGYPGALADIDPALVKTLRQNYFAELDQHMDPHSASGIVVDKFPLNIVDAGLIHRIFPQSVFIFSQRHPCDCVLSCFMQNFGLNDAMANCLDLKDTAHLYDIVMELWQTYRTILPLKVHTVRYESLIRSFDDTLRPLLEFLEVAWDDEIRNYRKTAYDREKINTPSYNQVTQPLYTHAQDRWTRYSKHLAPVLPTLQPWIKGFDYDA